MMTALTTIAFKLVKELNFALQNDLKQTKIRILTFNSEISVTQTKRIELITSWLTFKLLLDKRTSLQVNFNL